MSNKTLNKVTGKMAVPDFRKIQFGMADAQTEGMRYPDLLINGYLDASDIAKEAVEGHRFLFLGYKGAGKSALSEHLRLTKKGDASVFYNDILLKSFPYKLFNKIVKGDAEQEAKYTIAWEWILLLYVIDSFYKDESATLADNEEWTQTLYVLKKEGIYPLKSITDIVKKSSKNTFKINLGIGEFGRESESSTVYDIDLVRDHLKDLLLEVKTVNRHFLVIDGLDEFLSDRDIQHKSIISLINVAKDLNVWFHNNDIPFKIIILCRTDMFDQISDSNKNKLRRDFSVPLRWVDEAEVDEYERAPLVRLANLRTRLVYPNIENVFEQFFPETYRTTPIPQALLEYTRHIPRDFLQLLVFIQEVMEGPCVSIRDISAGIKKYSLEYFSNEISDELAGKVGSNEIKLLFELLSQLRKEVFSFNEVVTLAESKPESSKLDLKKLFGYLFECSAIGHLKKERSDKGEGEKEKFYIKYRNPSMVFDASEKIILHRGLRKALVS